MLSDQVIKGQSFWPELSSSSKSPASLCSISLRRSCHLLAGCVSSHRRRSSSLRPNFLPGPEPALPARQPALHWLLAGGKSRSCWGVGLSAPVLHSFKPLGSGEMTLTCSNCQRASQCVGEEGWQRTQGERRRSRHKRDGWQGVRCELSREMFVRQLYGVKQLREEAGCSHSD